MIPMHAIFISYRRHDSAEASRGTAQRLSKIFGEEAVFLDVEAIEAGADFSQVILDGVRAASVMLVMIGPHWLNGINDSRLEDPKDFVRREIETALEWRVPIIPVLIEGTSMPGKEDLPATIHKLATLQAHLLTEPEAEVDIDCLADLMAKAYDVEPLPVDRLTYLGGRLQKLRRYPFHLARLIVHPKRYLAARALGRRRDSIDAIVFLAVSTVIAVWLAIAEWPGMSWLLFVSGISVAFIATLFLSFPLYLAWRIAGSGRAYGRVLTVLSYQSSIVHVGLGLSGLIFFGGINISDPGYLLRVRQVIVEQGVGGTLSNDINALSTTAGWIAVIPYVLVFNCVLLAWLISSWGAYRRALGLSRIRSLVAFALTVLIVSVPILISVFTAALI
jgi:TIR domain